MLKIELTEKQIEKIKNDELWWYRRRHELKGLSTNEEIVDRIRHELRMLEKNAVLFREDIDEIEMQYKEALALHKADPVTYSDGYRGWGDLYRTAKKHIAAFEIMKPIYEKMIAELING